MMALALWLQYLTLKTLKAHVVNVLTDLWNGM